MMMNNNADQRLMRKINTRTVIDVLRKQQNISRANISTYTGLNRSTVSSIIDNLIEEGWVRETEYQTEKVGRPGLNIELNPNCGFVIGLEIGVDFIIVATVNFAQELFYRKRIDTNPDDGQIKIQELAFHLVSEAIEIGKEKCNRPLGIGIALPGMVDIHEGVLKQAPNLHWENVPIRLIWTQQFHLPVIVENEANAAAIGEYYYGAAKGINDFIYIAAGFGLGSGIIIGGNLLRGNKGYAAEVGHMSIDPEGEHCNCGKQGCYEMMIGPRAVVKRFKRLLTDRNLTNDEKVIDHELSDGFGYQLVVNAAKNNDSLALEALEDVGSKLGLVVSNLINLFNPKMVVLGGALNNAKEFIDPVVKKVVKKNALQLCQQDLVITNSTLDQDASVMGVTGLLFDNIWE